MQNTLNNLWQSPQTVFTISQLASLLQEPRTELIVKRMYYYVRQGSLLSLRRGVYAKPQYNPEELACALYTPCYLSLEYVLQQAGVVFQMDETLTVVSPLSRTLTIDGHTFRYRQMRGDLIASMAGIENRGNINIAIPERALLDTMYLQPHCHFDNLHPLSRRVIRQLLPVYQNKRLTERVEKMFAQS